MASAIGQSVAPRASRRDAPFVVLAVVAAGALASWIAISACLPALEVGAAAVDAGADARVVDTGPFCGDGVIDYDAASSSGGEQCDLGDAAGSFCTRGATGCQVDCPGGYVDPDTNHCYFVLEAGATQYPVARDRCIGRGAHLVTFASSDEREKVVGAGLYAGPLVFWVGITQDPQVGGYTTAEGPNGSIGEPGWSQACSGCYAFVPDGGAIPKARQDAGFFENGVNNNGPAVGDSRFAQTWFQLPQSLGAYAAGVICEREPDGVANETCPGGRCIFVKRTLGAKRYLFVATDVTADDADHACRSLPDGKGHLVVLESREEREQLMKEVARALAESGDPATGVWIGLARASDTAPWIWDDGAPLSDRPDPWGEREPSGKVPGAARAYAGLSDARALDTQLAHADVIGTKRPYVCQD